MNVITPEQLKEISQKIKTYIGEVLNEYYDKDSVNGIVNNLATQNYVDTKVSGLVNSAPATLDTLNELANALGNDPNFATTISNQIGNKLDKSGGTLTGNLTGKHIIGTWLQTTETSNLNSACTKVAVLNGSGWVYYRTPAQILSDSGCFSYVNGVLTINL